MSGFCAFLLALCLCACAGGGGEAAGSTGGGGDLDDLKKMMGVGGPWVDSDLIGSVTADMEIREQDDFAAAVNKEWKLEQGDKVCQTFEGVSEKVAANAKKILTDPSIKGETVECLRNYYKLASDWDQRNKDGMEPLKPYIKDIESIDSVDGLYDFFADPVRNPLRLAPVTVSISNVGRCESHPDSYAVYFTSPELTLSRNGSNSYYFDMDEDEAFECYEQVTDQASYMLKQLGYSDREASDLISACMVWEKSLAAANNKEAVTGAKDFTCSRKKAVELAGDFPFEKIINGWGFQNTKYYVILPSFAKKWASLCSQGNLEKVKAFLIVHYCLRSWNFLDRTTCDKMREYGKPRLVKSEGSSLSGQDLDDALILDQYIGRTPMVGAMSRVYVENFFDDSQTKDLNDMTQKIIDSFEEIFNEEDWLSAEGKKACVEKLKAIKIHVAYQNFDSVDYGKLKIKTHDQGGNFLEAYYAARRFETDHLSWLACQPYDPAYWDPMDPDLSTMITNACYMPDTNGIYIFAGICDEPIYSKDMSYEEKLGGLFAIIGHEITHGFDKDGAMFDKDGFKDNILPLDDQSAFNDKVEMVAAYYSTLVPYVGAPSVSGVNVNTEATADMGGIRAALQLAKKESNFDYDLFFRTYARTYRTNVSEEEEKNMITMDVHPLAFHRINVGLQQFDEFYQTYGIGKDDGMYLEPKKRIKVW